MSVLAPAPTIEARAGRDRTAITGASVDFEGTAIGLLGVPIDNARFWWNLGDGATAEGRRVSHVWRVPGTYITGLSVSSGAYAAADYITVTVVPNKVAITEVTQGSTGFIRLSNGSDAAVDLSGWIIEEGEIRRFILPIHTMMRGRGEAALAHAVTGLSGTAPLRVRFPDGSVAFDYQPKSAASTPESAPAPAPAPAALMHAPLPSVVPETTRQKADAPELSLAVPPGEVSSSSPHAPAAAIGTVGSGSGYGFLGLAALLSAGASVAFFWMKRFFA